MQRLERRLRILRGKRAGAFDPDQVYLERAMRTRAARKVRSLLRRGAPVLLFTPRWSQAGRFLDDVATDLGLSQPALQARPLSLLPLQGRSAFESWTWLLHAVMEFCGLQIDGPVAAAVDRHGFRYVMSAVFRRTLRGPKRALLVHGLEYLHVEARDDLVRVFEDHMDEAGDERKLTLLLAGAIDSPNFEIRGAGRVSLPDFGRREGIEALVEYTGPADRKRLEAIVSLLGGVPALLDRVGAQAEQSGELVADREALWRALGPLADEVRGAVAIVSAVDGLAERLELVAKNGPLPEDARWDRMLVRAGIFQQTDADVRRVMVRAPLFADLAAAR